MLSTLTVALPLRLSFFPEPSKPLTIRLTVPYVLPSPREKDLSIVPPFTTTVDVVDEELPFAISLMSLVTTSTSSNS